MASESTINKLREQIYKIIKTLPSDIAFKYVHGTYDESEKIFRTYIKPKLDPKLFATGFEQFERTQTPNAINSLLMKTNETKTKSIFLDSRNRQSFLSAVESFQEMAEHDDIFAFGQHVASFPTDVFHVIKHRWGKPIVINKKILNQREIPDFSHVVVIGDFDCSGYNKNPKTDEDANKILKVLPYGVLGKLDCHGWDKILFKKIKKLPYADTIDCSFSIESLSDLTNMIQPGLKELIIEDKFIKEANIESAKAFLTACKNTHPNLVLTGAKDNYQKLSLEIIASKATADLIQAQQVATDAIIDVDNLLKQNGDIISESDKTKAEKAISDLTVELASPEVTTKSLKQKTNTLLDVAKYLQKAIDRAKTTANKVNEVISKRISQTVTNVAKYLATDEGNEIPTAVKRDREKLRYYVGIAFRELNKTIGEKDYNDIKKIILREINIIEPLAKELGTSVDTVRDLVKETLFNNPEMKTYDEIRDAVKDAMTQLNELNEQKKTNQDKVADTPKGKEPAKPTAKAGTTKLATNCKILKYVSKRFLSSLSRAESEEVRNIMRLFNVYDQPNMHATSVYVDQDGNQQTLSKFTCKGKNIFGWGHIGVGANKRIIFKSTTLTDAQGNIVKDENGNPIYVLISCRYYAIHDKRKTQKEYATYVSDTTIAVSTDGVHDPANDIYSISRLDSSGDYEKYEWPEPESPSKEQSNDIIKDATTIDKDSIHELPKDASFKPVFDDNGEQLPTFYDDFQLSNDSAVSTKNKFDAATGLLNQRDAEHEKTKASNVITRLFGGKGSHDK